jgi:acetyl esterase/lipase
MTAAEVIALWPEGPPTVIDGVPAEDDWIVNFGVAKGQRFIRNISEPSLSVFTPTSESNGNGVIVVPGGGWTINAWGHEGLEVADWLTPLGYTVFLLKYRVMASETDRDKFERRWAKNDAVLPGTMAKAAKPRAIGDILKTDRYPAARAAAADDGRRAIALAREHAGRFGVRPESLGMLGFSAGAFMAVDIALDPRAEQLAWIAPVYGGETGGAPIPADAPPLFTAVAEDDILVRIVEGLVHDWTMADRSAEVHHFSRGGHGFGMVKQGTPSDRWTELFLRWHQDLDRSI